MNQINNSFEVSIIIVTWNSGDKVLHCLQSLGLQSMEDFELIILDNGSTDGSLDGIKTSFPNLNLRIEYLRENLGFSCANNLGARLAQGKWIALLNSDAFPEPTWLENLIRAARNNPEFSFFASRQIQANASELLDGAGDACHVSGLAWRRFAGYPADRYGLEFEEVFSPCAAAALYPRQIFLEAGGFDEDFFSYHEDVDLGFRLRLQGYRCLYVPDAVVQHVGSASAGAKSDFALYYWQRNYIWSFIKNMPSSMFWSAIPAHLFANFVHLVIFTLQGRGKVIWKAKWDALKGFSKSMTKRRIIQKSRKISREELLRVMEKGFMQPYLLGRRIQKISRGIDPRHRGP